jgi:hypothetical protein
MSRIICLVVIAGAWFVGCSGAFESETPATTEARRQIGVAQSLESAGNLREAAHEYLMVAEGYPMSDVWPLAVRKTGVLYARPQNPARNDSIALRWLNVYEVLTTDPGEKDLLQELLFSLNWNRALSAEGARQQGVVDSLSEAVRRLTSSLTSRTRENEELNVQLRKTSEELKKLKEIDVRTSRKRRAP